jgi:hypothetical protein
VDRGDEQAAHVENAFRDANERIQGGRPPPTRAARGQAGVSPPLRGSFVTATRAASPGRFRTMT